MTRASCQHAHLSLTGQVVGLPDDAEINALDERAAMGLPSHAIRVEDVRLRQALQQIRGNSSSQLTGLVEDKGQPFATRHAAAVMLGLLGDPRIDVFHPVMIDVPGGHYRVGLPAHRVDAVTDQFGDYGVKREWILKEAPDHDAWLQSYRIGKYPVTNEEYATFVEDTAHAGIPSSWSLGCMPIGQANHPVHTITPEDADAYAAWLSAKTGRCFRLPTESEWEVAATGGTAREYPWGEEFVADCANTLEAGVLSTTPVGIFPAGASGFGCLDMAGNVEEFVADSYRAYPGGEQVNDDLVIRGGAYRVARGGSFARYRDLARCRRRHGYFARRIYVMGFRLAETVR